MLDRRQFSFAALLAVISSPAAAETVPMQNQGPSLIPSCRVKRKGGEIHVDLTLRNTGPDPIDLLLARGSRPGPQVFATLADGSQLEEIVELGRRDMMSRVGPLPRYAPLASGAEVDVGTYRFVWVEKSQDPVFDLSIEVYTGDQTVALSVRRLSPARAGV